MCSVTEIEACSIYGSLPLLAVSLCMLETSYKCWHYTNSVQKMNKIACIHDINSMLLTYRVSQLKCNTFQWFIVLRLEGKYGMVNMIWLDRVILSNYFDTTLDGYCFTDDVTGAGIVTEVKKKPCANFYMVSEWETQLKKQMAQSFDMVSLGVFACCLFIHGTDDPQNGIKIIGEIYSSTPHHIHRYIPSNLQTMNHWKVLRFNWLTL